MTSPIIAVTVQAAVFSAMSTTLAQAMTVYKHQKFSVINPVSFLHFMIIAIIVTPPNYLYQKWLEDTFPARPTSTVQKEKDDKPKDSEQQAPLSIQNTVAKFFLDQSISAAANTAAFIVLAALLKGKSSTMILNDLEKNFWSMLFAGWRVWPMVTLLNLVVVPFDQRALVGNTAGLLWGVYMNLKAA